VKKIIIILVIFVTFILIIIKITSECDYRGSWGRGPSKSCDCKGIKILLFDDLAVDGDYLTVCVGVAYPK